MLKSDPNNVRAWYFKGIVLQHLGQAEPRFPASRKWCKRGPMMAWPGTCWGCASNGWDRSAERELLKAMELRPYLGSAYYKLWQALQAEGQTDKAQPYLEKFKQLRENPLNETIELPQYNQMGDLALARPLPAQNYASDHQERLLAQARRS